MSTTIEINQTIRSKRKTLAIIVKPDGSLIVRAPLRASEKTIRKFVENNVQWIEKKQAEVRATVPPSPNQYIAGEMFIYLGNAYPLEIVNGQKKPLLLDESFKLAELAYKAHTTQPDLIGTADIPESDLLSGLMSISQNLEIRPNQLLEYLSTRAGLLVLWRWRLHISTSNIPGIFGCLLSYR